MAKKETNSLLSKEQKANAAALVREYLSEHCEVEIGGLQADFLIDFITDNIGPYYYNRGIADSVAFISDKVEDMYVLLKDENI